MQTITMHVWYERRSRHGGPDLDSPHPGRQRRRLFAA